MPRRRDAIVEGPAEEDGIADAFALLLGCDDGDDDDRLLIPKKQSIIHMTSSTENMQEINAPLMRLGIPPQLA